MKKGKSFEHKKIENQSILHGKINEYNIKGVKIVTNSPYEIMENFGKDSKLVSDSVTSKKETKKASFFAKDNKNSNKDNLFNSDLLDCTPIQAVAIPALLNAPTQNEISYKTNTEKDLTKNSIVVRAPTGMGKTYAYLYPTIKNLIESGRPKNSKISTLVLVPVKELAEQVKTSGRFLIKNMLSIQDSSEDEFYFKNIGDISNKSLSDIMSSNIELLSSKLSSISASQNMQTKRKVDKIFINSLYGGKKVIPFQLENTDILVATTGKLLDFLMRKSVDLSGVTSVILDEADKMMDMGFKEDVDTIMGIIADSNYNNSYLNETQKTNLYKKCSVCCFSATYNKHIQEIIRKYMPEKYINIEVKNEVVETIKQTFIKTNNKLRTLIEILNGCNLDSSWASRTSSDKIIIFVERKIDVEKLKSQLIATRNNKYIIDILHGDMEQNSREIALKRFQLNSNILIATSVAARGIDIKDIKKVINYDIPKDIKEYIHRIGRTGREGKKGEAISLYENVADIGKDMVKDLANVISESNNQEVKDFTNYISNLSSNSSLKSKSTKNKKPVEKDNHLNEENFNEKEDSDADYLNDEW